MTALLASLVERPVPLGGHSVRAADADRWLLQERDTTAGSVIRSFAHATAACAIAEMQLLASYQPHRYAGGSRVLVVVDPAGTVIAHTGVPGDLLPEWRSSVADPDLQVPGGGL